MAANNTHGEVNFGLLAKVRILERASSICMSTRLFLSASTSCFKELRVTCTCCWELKFDPASLELPAVPCIPLVEPEATEV